MPRNKNSILIQKRDEALLRRYHYWTEVQRLRFDDALKILSQQEFFLSEARIMAIIRKAAQSHTEIKPVPQVKKPRITAAQLSLFLGEA